MHKKTLITEIIILFLFSKPGLTQFQIECKGNFSFPLNNTFKTQIDYGYGGGLQTNYFLSDRFYASCGFELNLYEALITDEYKLNSFKVKASYYIFDKQIKPYISCGVGIINRRIMFPDKSFDKKSMFSVNVETGLVDYLIKSKLYYKLFFEMNRTLNNDKLLFFNPGIGLGYNINKKSG